MTRTVRNLENLRQTGSTARVLNLLQIWREHGDDPPGAEPRTPDWAMAPLFQHPALNRAIILKHRLRRDEGDVFGVMTRRLSTKVILPISSNELKYGGQYFFVDELGFASVIQDVFGLDLDHRDVKVLRLMDRLPSLDPFLLREQLRRNGVEAGACYFALSPSDLKRMEAFVQAEITPLVTLSLGGDTIAVADGSARVMAAKILSDSSGTQLDALRETLRLAPHQYQEGVFCWKGFLYYKWSLESLMGEVARVASEVHTLKPKGAPDRAARAELARLRAVVGDDIFKTCESVRRTLMVYDEAYSALRRGRPNDFRDFLLNAPKMFSRLGEELGVIQHIVSFWRYRFGAVNPSAATDELLDILSDFEQGLAMGTDRLAA